jgi:uncharacterized phage-associated protein
MLFVDELALGRTEEHEMRFRFDIDKSIAATAFIIRQAGGRYNVLPIVKVLYHANRTFLVRYGRTITGDRLVSMNAGPVVSQTYDLLKGSTAADPTHLLKWATFISPRHGNSVTLLALPEMGYLSEKEIEVLKESQSVISKVKTKLSDWSHAVFPEWKDPKGGSEDIDPKDILRSENKSEDEISEIEGEINSVNWLKSIAR